MKSVPVSKIDALIAEIRDLTKLEGITYEKKWVLVGAVIPMLEDLEKESEEMIPLSTVEARIKELEWCLNDLKVWGCNNIGEIKYKLETTIQELTKDKDPS